MKSKTISIEVVPPERYAFIDLTEDLQRAIKDAGVTEGAAIAFCAHTTTALIINEWEDGAMEDFRRRIRRLVPDVDHYYAHDDHERRFGEVVEHERVNGHAHVQAMLVSATSQAIPVSSGEPMLGTWQRLMLVELDEPKARTIVFQVFGE